MRGAGRNDGRCSAGRLLRRKKVGNGGGAPYLCRTAIFFENMKTIEYLPVGVCSRHIRISVEDDGTVAEIAFTGGCHGNTQGVAALAKGMPVAEVVARLKGIDCKGKGTSCPDQLAKALETLE